MKKEPPPESLPIYRLLTGPDDAEFCKRVSEALGMGYVLYGPPTMTYDTERKRVIVGQALFWRDA